MIYAEAKAMVREFGTDTWRDSLDLDPIQLPILAYQPGTEIPSMTDAWDRTVIDFVDALEEAEADSNDTLEYTAVWSDFGFEVKTVCPECGASFPVGEGWSANVSGVRAVVCGCDDED